MPGGALLWEVSKKGGKARHGPVPRAFRSLPLAKSSAKAHAASVPGFVGRDRIFHGQQSKDAIRGKVLFEKHGTLFFQLKAAIY
jgi:hypothetical protein